ncbi:hypothetical protein ACFSTJ_00925 [Ottowia pentelensis]|uniref:hypothetical protein n=1 Tax=Ottowia pentelensis TaxID=511108 RepID=UPI0036434AED
MRRLSPAEPLVMLATIALWLVLAMLTGALVGSACSVFLHLLFASEGACTARPGRCWPRCCRRPGWPTACCCTTAIG